MSRTIKAALTMKFLMLFIITCTLRSVLNLELPTYIPKCSLKDPNVNGCVKTSANIAIPEIVKGVEEFGIPVLSPLYLPNATLEGNNLKMSLKNVQLYGLENLILSEAQYNLTARKAGFIADLDALTLSGEYSISSGRILTYSVSGNGKTNITLVKNTVKYNCDIRVYTKDGELHQEFVNSTIDLDTNRGYYYFENLQTLLLPLGSNINSLIDLNWQVLRDETEPSIENYIMPVVYNTLNAITDNLPINRTIND